MWNFSNGSCLTELLSEDPTRHSDSEITGIVCAFDPKTEGLKMAHIIAVGTDKKIHIWADEKEEEVFTCKTLPKDQKG